MFVPDSVEKYPDNEPGLLDVVCVYRRGLVIRYLNNAGDI